jgi:hypothetical protein
MLPKHRAQRRLRDLRCGDHEVLDLNDRRLRLDDPEIGDRVYTRRHVVLGDYVLRRDVERDRAEVDPHHPVDDRDQDEQTRSLWFWKQAPEAENDRALVLARHLECRDQQEHEQKHQGRNDDERDGH